LKFDDSIVLGPHFTEMKTLIELAKETGMTDIDWFMNGLEQLSRRWNGYLYEKMLRMCLDNRKNLLLNTTFPIPTNREELEQVDGQYKIGTIMHTNVAFGLTPLQLMMHAVIAGQSGFGKSTLIKILLKQILEQRQSLVWLWDPKGESGDFRFVAKDFEDVVILRPEVMKCNPFTPIPNVSAALHRESITEVLAGAWGVMDAGEGVIIEHIDKVMKQNEKPTMFDFIDSLASEKNVGYGRRQGYLDTLETRRKKAGISLGEILDCKEDYVPKLYSKNVIFEIGELSPNAQEFLVNFLLMDIMLYKMKNPTQNLSHVIIFDEAQTSTWARFHEMSNRTPFVAKLATQARGWGLSLVVLAQNPVMKLMREITANSAIKISFQLGSHEEAIGFGRTMGLTDEQIEALHHFGRGEAVCRTSLGYTYPVHLEIFNMEDQRISTAELTEIMKPRWDMLMEGIEPAKPEKTHDSKMAKSLDIQSQRPLGKSSILKDTVADDLLTPKPIEVKKTAVVNATDTGLTPDEQAYLRIVSTHPWRLIGEVYCILNDPNIMGSEHTISQARAVKIRQKLIKMGYMESINISGSGKPGKPQCDIHTDKAQLGNVHKPRGNFEHAFWAYRVSYFFGQKGGKTKIGDTLSGNEVDIEVELDNIRIGVEIVISTLVIENLGKFISKCYFDEMLVLCIDDKKKGEMKKAIGKLDDNIREKVKVELLKDYFISI